MSAAGSSEISGASRWLAAPAPSGAARPANRAAIAAPVTSTTASASPPLRTVMRPSLSWRSGLVRGGALRGSGGGVRYRFMSTPRCADFVPVRPQEEPGARSALEPQRRTRRAPLGDPPPIEAHGASLPPHRGAIGTKSARRPLDRDRYLVPIAATAASGRQPARDRRPAHRE